MRIRQEWGIGKNAHICKAVHWGMKRDKKKCRKRKKVSYRALGSLNEGYKSFLKLCMTQKIRGETTLKISLFCTMKTS